MCCPLSCVSTTWKHAASGTGAIECARHNMKRPNAVGDLQRKENGNLCLAFISYGVKLISNQLLQHGLCVLQEPISINTYNARHLLRYPVSMVYQFSSMYISILVLVRRFRQSCATHIPRPQITYSGACSGMPDQLFFQTDKEVVIQMAKLQNVVGPRSILWQPARKRWVAHFGFFNWKKSTGTGLTLLYKAKATVDDMYDHVIAHEELH